MYQTVYNMKARDNRGFTLIELLIVIGIIAILAAIAIPQFAEHRQRAVEASMISDARNATMAIATVFVDSGSYAGALDPTPLVGAAGTWTVDGYPAAPVRASAGNSLTIAGDATTFTVTVDNTGARTGRTRVTIDYTGAISWLAAP